MTYSGYYATGIREILDMINEYVAFTKSNGYFYKNRDEQAKFHIYESIQYMLRESFYNNPDIEKQLPIIESKVLHKEISPYIAAKKMIDLFLKE
jgi:LAO/AO transport system kinase